MAPERIERAPAFESTAHTVWWSAYRNQAETGGLTETALKVVDLDAEYILRQGVLGAGAPGDAGGSWPPSRVRKGLVVGSVQSGKTASMLAVAAKCLDAKIDVVILLAGTRVSLWRQTLDRVVEQLDGWSEPLEGERTRARVMIPEPRLLAGHESSIPILDLYQVNTARVRRTLAQGRPILAVAMKNSDHVMRLASNVRGALAAVIPRLDRALHMVVIDDEADDGSILDSVVESGYGTDSELLKQLPRHITGLWSQHSGHSQTFDAQLFATYVAYTATPQANVLQSDHNPLSPEHFMIALRTPGTDGSVEPPRVTTYREPSGPQKHYSGGEVFYRATSAFTDPLCVVIDERTDGDGSPAPAGALETERDYLGHLGAGLRAFFVAAAMRLLHDGRRISTLVGRSDVSEAALAKDCPPPSCMLVNPAASISTQLEVARLIAAWSADADLGSLKPGAYPRDSEGRAVIDPAGLLSRLEREENLWRAWYHSYERTREQLVRAEPMHGFAGNEPSDWFAVKDLLAKEVFPHVRLAVVNSDPLADDRPSFRLIEGADNLFRPPRDLVSIFVSGNVMARGITLEGLTTTMFLRDPNQPAADTQMQMQRWFGYRGAHLYWCRVFLYADQLELFRTYHEHDEALKGEVLAAMNSSPGTAPTPMVLQGARFRATAKIANLRALPLCPGRQPFVGVLALDDGPREANLGVVEHLLDSGNWKNLTANGSTRGVIREEPADFLEVAVFLESLRYDQHDPDPGARNNTRWESIAKGLELREPEAPLFRPPGVHAQRSEVVAPSACPYSIAAYLRLWRALLTRGARGFFPTDDHRTPWSMISLADYAAHAPEFFIGVRYGGEDAGLAENQRLAARGIRRVVRDHEGVRLKASWGSRNPGGEPDAYLGDHMFDYYHHGRAIPTAVTESGWRRRGEPGLLLLHVVKTERGGSVVPALVLPLGGPDHFAAIAPGNHT